MDLICLLSQVSLIVFVKSQLINHLGVPHLGNVAFGSFCRSTPTERNNEYGLYDRGQDWNERASAGFFIHEVHKPIVPKLNTATYMLPHDFELNRD